MQWYSLQNLSGFETARLELGLDWETMWNNTVWWMSTYPDVWTMRTEYNAD